MNYIRIFVGKQKVENKDYPIDISGDTQFDEIIDIIHNKIHSIKIIQDDITYHYSPKTQTFQIKSTPKSDIYEVYKDKKLQSIACIDTYSCSLAMNRLFHPTDIFVEKTLTMECKWNETFKKWTPIV